MAQIEFVVPDPATNYFTNPRVGDGVTGFTAVGSTRTQSIERARWGMYSIKVVTAGAAADEGVYALTSFAAPGTAVAQFYWGSVYLRGAGIVRVRLYDVTHALNFYSSTIILNDVRWQRVDVGGFIPANCLALRIYVETTTIQTVTYYIDGIQCEDNSYLTTYIDGEREQEIPSHDGFVYYKWTGTIHGSSSMRSAECRTGGRTHRIENVDTQLYITEMSGLGMPPIDLFLSEYATRDRSEIEGWRPMPRVVNLLFSARRFNRTRACSPSSLHELHREREALEAIVKPDLSPNTQPILMRYQDGKSSRKVELFMTYEGGLEWEGDIRDSTYNEFMVRFLAADPYFYEDTQDVHTLVLGREYLGDADYIAAKIDGVWTEIGDADGNVYKIAVHPISGDVYVGGAFTTIDGVTANTAYIARWDGEQWNSLGGAAKALNGAVRAIDFSVDGWVFLGGNFVTVGGVNHNYITQYDPDGDNFAFVGPGPGLDDVVYDFAVDDGGYVYVVGLFHQDSTAVFNYNHVVRYNPGTNTFANMGAGPGLDEGAVCATVDNDGRTIYIGGEFTTTVGGAANLLDSLTRYDPDDDDFYPMGTGLNAALWVIDILCTHDNRVYAVGEFDHIGYIDVGYVGVWNGSEWYPLGAEEDGFILYGGGSYVRALHENYKNLLFIGGDIASATGAALYRRVGTWNRSRFQHSDILLPAAPVFTIASRGDDIWLGFGSAASVFAAEVFTIDNIGKTTTYPVLEVVGPLHIQWLENQTTGQIVRIDLSVNYGERVVFDFRPWNRFVRSTHRKHVEKAILPDSDGLMLLPGENVLAMFCEDGDDESLTEISLRWPIIHWGFDDIQ